MLAHGLAHGLPAVHALTHLDNHPSQAVARRIGMRDLGVLEKWYAGPSRVFRTDAPDRSGSGDPRAP